MVVRLWGIGCQFDVLAFSVGLNFGAEVAEGLAWKAFFVYDDGVKVFDEEWLPA